MTKQLPPPSGPPYPMHPPQQPVYRPVYYPQYVPQYVVVQRGGGGSGFALGCLITILVVLFLSLASCAALFML